MSLEDIVKSDIAFIKRNKKDMFRIYGILLSMLILTIDLAYLSWYYYWFYEELRIYHFLFVFCLVMLIYYCFHFPLSFKARLKSYKKSGVRAKSTGKKVLVFKGTGIYIEGEYSCAEYQYCLVKDIYMEKDIINIFLFTYNLITIPLRAFENESHMQSFIGELRAKTGLLPENK